MDSVMPALCNNNIDLTLPTNWKLISKENWKVGTRSIFRYLKIKKNELYSTWKEKSGRKTESI